MAMTSKTGKLISAKILTEEDRKYIVDCIKKGW